MTHGMYSLELLVFTKSTSILHSNSISYRPFVTDDLVRDGKGKG